MNAPKARLMDTKEAGRAFAADFLGIQALLIVGKNLDFMPDKDAQVKTGLAAKSFAPAP